MSRCYSYAYQESELSQWQTLVSFFSSGDYDGYLREAHRGSHILAVHLSRQEQMKQVRNLLVPHGARLMKYIDTWTVADLLP